VSTDLSYSDGVKVLRRGLGEVTGEFDCIMMHHSFEHMNQPHAVLAEVRRLLAPGGRALIRIPLCSLAAFREYRSDWVQLDAPRHFFLHSRQSMGHLARAGGFVVERVLYDSTAFQFWGSEQYRLGLPLLAQESYAVNRRASVFSRSQIAAFEVRARILNAQEDGDPACFILA
jgi:SAM-dependent methyltransferase